MFSIKNRAINVSAPGWIFIIAITLSACTQTEPTKINEAPMFSRVSSSETILQNDDDLQNVADMWRRSGRSPVHLIATYRPTDKDIAQRNAQTAAMRLKGLGVKDVDIDLLPASNNQVIAQMKLLTAGAVSSCTNMPENGEATNSYNFPDYRLGCGVDKYMGIQVAHTPDLEGRVPGQGYGRDTDGMRQTAIVDGYRTGKPNEPLKGLSSSDIATGN